MRATLLLRKKVVYSEASFAELVIWWLPEAVEGSTHRYKYRLAYVVDGVCVVRYDNEVRKGDHRHYGVQEFKHSFTTAEALLRSFEHDIGRWNRENSRP